MGLCASKTLCGVIMECHLGFLKYEMWHNLISTEEELFVFYAFNVLQRQDELCSRRALHSVEGKC